MAKEAVTPPVVGSTGTEIKGIPASFNLFTAPEVLAICINDRIPSCILAPPELETTTTGIFFSSPLSRALVIFSPTTEPMLPPIKLNSITAILTSIPFIFPVPLITPSSILLFS